MPHLSKVKGGWKVTNKETGSSKFYKSKAAAMAVVAKGYGRKKGPILKQVKPKRSLDYGTKMFSVDSWKPENLTKTE